MKLLAEVALVSSITVLLVRAGVWIMDRWLDEIDPNNDATLEQKEEIWRVK
jgi:hypothetical protein